MTRHDEHGRYGLVLAPACSARRGEYRVIYLIDDDARVVKVTAVAHRADAYRT